MARFSDEELIELAHRRRDANDPDVTVSGDCAGEMARELLLQRQLEAAVRDCEPYYRYMDDGSPRGPEPMVLIEALAKLDSLRECASSERSDD